MKLKVLFALLLPTSVVHAAPINDFGDIQYWVGTGENRAGLVIDWDGEDSGNQSLVWGYRWDGNATAETMLRDVVIEDDRLYAKLGEAGGFGTPVYGIGYDANDNGEFGVTPEDFEHPFDPSGLAIVETAHLGQPTDAGDYYADGWRFAYWHHAQTTGLPQGWGYGQGVASQTLVNEAWTSLAFTTDTRSLDIFPPSQLIAAEPPGLAGDFNADGKVDAADYTVWRDMLGDFESYQLWRNNFGTNNAPSSAGVPEPHSLLLLLLLGISQLMRSGRVPRKFH